MNNSIDNKSKNLTSKYASPKRKRGEVSSRSKGKKANLLRPINFDVDDIDNDVTNIKSKSNRREDSKEGEREERREK